jgi:GNAT superfamily N-acetyltransferase
MKVSHNLPRRERRAVKKLGHTLGYKNILYFFRIIFSPVKYFVTLPFATARKVFWVISYSIYKLFGIKVAYIDDFIIHKQLRGHGYAQNLFEDMQQKILYEKCDYLLLFSDKNRKASHKFYKKMWLTIIGLWIGIVAYKKINKQK